MSDPIASSAAPPRTDPLKPPAGPPARRPALVIQTAFLGDVVLTTPLLTALAARHGPVDVVTTPGAAPLLETHPAVRTVIRYDKRRADRGWRGLRRLGDRLRANGYGRVYLPHRSARSAALALLAGIPERIGYAGASAAITYTRTVPRPAKGHEVERLFALAEPAPGVAAPPATLGLTAEDRAVADRWLAEQGVTGGFVALAPGSTWGTKRWPYYPELAAALDRPVVVVGGPEDAELAARVVAAAGGRARSAAGALPLRASAALIARADALITNDSAPLHLATAVGTPIVAVFGPTVPAFGFGPRAALDRIVEHPAMPCRPCSAHGPPACPLGHHHCMTQIPVSRVLAELAATSSGEGRREVRTRD